MVVAQFSTALRCLGSLRTSHALETIASDAVGAGTPATDENGADSCRTHVATCTAKQDVGTTDVTGVGRTAHEDKTDTARHTVHPMHRETGVQ